MLQGSFFALLDLYRVSSFCNSIGNPDTLRHKSKR